MFNDNKYTRWYYAIVIRARNTARTGYTEKHHVIPKSLGGTDEKCNLVRLTAREHFICHLLLVKMCSGLNALKMKRAIKMMVTSSKKQSNRIKPSARWVEYARKNGNAASIGVPRPQHVKDKIGKSNKGKPAWNKGRQLPEEQKKKLSAAMQGRIPWNLGVRPSEEAIEKQRKSLVGHKMTDEQRAKMSAAKKGKPPNNKGKGKRLLALASLKEMT